MKAMKCAGFRIEGIEILNVLDELQRAVGGYIETLTLIPGKAVMIVNEEGRILGLPVNPAASALAGTLIVGTALIVGVDGEEFTDLAPEIARRILKKENA
jgi:hypothetical protein